MKPLNGLPTCKVRWKTTKNLSRSAWKTCAFPHEVMTAATFHRSCMTCLQKLLDEHLILRSLHYHGIIEETNLIVAKN